MGLFGRTVEGFVVLCLEPGGGEVVGNGFFVTFTAYVGAWVLGLVVVVVGG